MAIRSGGDRMKWPNWNWFGGRSGVLQNPDEGKQETRPHTVKVSANVSVTDERAMMVSAVFACVRVLVQSGATLPLGFFTRTKDGREMLETNHYLYDLLKYKPNNLMTAKEFRQAMWTQRVLWGNAYAKIKWLGKRPVSLLPLKPERMEVIRKGDELVYRYSTGSEHEDHNQKDIFHLKGWGSDGITGFAALGFMREVLGLSIAADQSASKAIGGTPNAVLEMDESLGIPTDKQKEELRNMYGAGESTNVYQSDGQLMITIGGMKYRITSVDPDKLQLLNTRQNQVPEVCRFFGVPVVMIDGSIGSTSSFPASFEQQVLYFKTIVLKPYLDEWEDTIPNSLLVTRDDQRTIYAEHNVEGLLRGDSKARSGYYNSALQNGYMTINEVRKRENLPQSPDPEADKLRVQLNVAPIDEVDNGNQNEPD